MKAEDLQIGDWINVFGAPKQVEGIRKFRNGDEVVYYDEYNGNFIKHTNITPILLTKEILEKNGWKIAGTSKEKYYWHEGILFCLPMCGFEYSNGRNVSPDKLFADDFFGTVNMRLLFVHELQHALRLCGIEKEIVL